MPGLCALFQCLVRDERTYKVVRWNLEYLLQKPHSVQAITLIICRLERERLEMLSLSSYKAMLNSYFSGATNLPAVRYHNL